MNDASYRQRLISYIREQAQPVDKFSHQARLYRLALTLSGSKPFDDDVLFAAAWIHDLGVFVGHRPEDPTALIHWDHVGYVIEKGPDLLRGIGFPAQKIPAAMDAVRTHMPQSIPAAFEGILLRDADILEQLGAVGILRTVSKVGRDTRYVRHSDALLVLRRSATELVGQLWLESARIEARKRIEVLEGFLAAAESEAAGVEW